VVVSSYIECRKFKSPQYVVTAFLWRSRETQRTHKQQIKQETKLLAAQLQLSISQTITVVSLSRRLACLMRVYFYQTIRTRFAFFVLLNCWQ